MADTPELTPAGGPPPQDLPLIEAGADVDTAAVTDDSGQRPRGVIAEWTVTILLLLFGTTTLVQAFVIPTGSMEDTLLIGDHLLVDKLAYAPPGPVSRFVLPYTPLKRGDIIVFRYPVNARETFVKRLVGLPGDRIRIADKTLYLNGEPLQEPYTYFKRDDFDYYRDNFPTDPNTRVDERALDMLDRHIDGDEIVVPPDSYFALGDNRDASLDSRYWGFVPRENIIGKPLLIYWSYDAPTHRLAGSGLDFEHLADLGKNFFTKTRWKRTFMLIRGHDPLQSK